jgi:NADH:ubiquinone oxidoreductase subunit 5 (subunit L)/multisubunit Na+/H+ antiporter MnhA subunit
MHNETLLNLAVFIPVLGSFLLPGIGKLSKKARDFFALALVACSFVACAKLVPAILAGNTINIFLCHLNLPWGLNHIFYADAVAVFMALVSSGIGAIIVLYSFDYIRHYPNQNEYYLMVVLFLGSMLGLVFSANLIYLYLFWEITAIACWRLIGFYREDKVALKADKAFLITVFGSLVMFLAFIIIYTQTGSFDLPALKDHTLPNIAVILILFGLLSKSATLPFQTWLPDAGVAPAPVTALLHAAVLVKIGVYVFARLFILTFILNPDWNVIVPIIAAASALVSAGAALIDTDLKRIIAYSTISQIGFIFLGLSTGNPIGAIGGLLYILAHGLAKGGLFLAAGIIEQNAKTKNITQLGGLLNSMPLTATAFLLCAFSIMGIPPFSGFFSKFLVITSAVEDQQGWIALTFIFGAVLTIVYLMRLFKMIFLGEAHQTFAVKEGSKLMVICVVCLGILSLLSGIVINFPINYLNFAMQQGSVLIK